MTTKTRAAWEDVRISLVFPRAHWKRVTVIRVERRTTKRSRGEARFEERYTLQCGCGKKWRIDSKQFNRANVKDCGSECAMRNPGPTPQEVLMEVIDDGYSEEWELGVGVRRVIRAAKAHGWKV